MKRQFLLFSSLLCSSLVLLLCTGCQTHFAQEFPTESPAGKTQILITFEKEEGNQVLPGGSKRSYSQNSNWGVPLYLAGRIDRLEKEFNIQSQTGWLMDSIDVHCFVFIVDINRDIDGLIQSIQSTPGVDYVQRMQEFSVMTVFDLKSDSGSATERELGVYNDSHLQLQFGGFVEQLLQLHTFTKGKMVKIGVVDTRSDLNHPDLSGQIQSQTVFVKSSAQSRPQNFAQHGTAVAGIISARANNGEGMVGLAPDAQLNIYAACDSQSNQRARCNTFNVLQALEQAIKDDVQVLNLSIAGPPDHLIEQVINVALEKDIVIIAAVNPQSPERSFPATMENVVAVQESVANQEAEQDLFGDWLVRSEKLSTLSGGGYQFFNGSSMSTASMSGIAALYRANASSGETRSFVEALVSGECDSGAEFATQNINEPLSRLLKASATCHR